MRVGLSPPSWLDGCGWLRAATAARDKFNLRQNRCCNFMMCYSIQYFSKWYWYILYINTHTWSHTQTCIYIYIYSLNTSSRDGWNHFWLPGTWHRQACASSPPTPGMPSIRPFSDAFVSWWSPAPRPWSKSIPVNQLGEPTCITCIATCLSVKTCRFSPPDRATRAKLWATCRRAVSWFSGYHLCRPAWEDM